MALRRTENSSGLLDLDNGLGGGYILSKICLSITLAVLGANIGLAQVVLREDFAALTLGDNTTISNQATVWTGDALFTTVVRAYQAGGAVKLGSFSAGSITSKALDLSGGAFDVSFDVKGWETVEGGITVTATGQTAQTVTYTSVMSGSFETKVVHFSAGTAATTITLATTARRAFLDNIIVTRVSSSVAPTVTISTGSYTYNGSYQGPGASDVNKGGSTGALTLQYGGSSMVGVQYGPTTIPPTGAGNYTLVATVAQDANYSQGVASANFTINKASATVNVSGTDQIYDGTPKQVAVITSPENLPVTIMYSGSSAAPTLAGDYSVMVTVTSPNYSGAASGRVLKIAKGTPLLSGITATSIAAGQALSTSTISGTAKNAAGTDVVGNWTFQNSSSTPSAGTNGQGVNFTPSDSTNYNTATGSVSVTVALDPTGDQDGDGLTNAEEVTRGTNPYQKDSDNDGVNDSKEVADGTNPTDATSYNSLSKGLVAYYQFSGNANDSSGNGNSGIPVSPVLSVDRLGVANAAYTFNGTTDRINLANSAALNMNNGVPFSMSAWIKTDFSDGQRVIMAKAAGASGNTPALFVDNEGKLRFDNFYINEVHSSATVRTGTWMHVAVTYDGSTYRLYVNGVADGEKAFTGSNELGNSWTFSIGGSLNTSFPSGMFKGSIDEVQFWSRTLSQSEVTAVVEGSATPAPSVPFTYSIENEKVTITGYTGTGGAVVIPGTIEGKPVTQIGNAAFKEKTSITAIALPDSVLSIGYEAFYRCEYLATVSLGSGVTTIGDWAFGHCYRLKSISIPNSVTSLGNGSLSDCIELESVILGNQVPSLGRYTFTNDYKLSSITLPASIASIGEQAFSHCTKLGTINFQQSVPPSVNADSFMDVAAGAMGYYPATAVLNWVGVTYSGITLRSNDQVAPVIALIGANELTIYKGSVFIDPGATVTDNVDTARTITGSGTVNTATVGVYTLTYTATDAGGNLALPVTRTVNVVLDPAADEDGDGLTNATEISGGTNPYQKDSDGDGVTDPVEIADGTNPNNASSYNSLNKGLVAYYPFEGSWADASGNGRNLTPAGASLKSNGRVNSTTALFPGTQSRADYMPGLAAAPIQEFSYAVWFKPSTLNRLTPNNEWIYLLDNTAQLRVCVGDPPKPYVDLWSYPDLGRTQRLSELKEGFWNHLVVTHGQDNQIRFLVNGMSVATMTNPASFNTNLYHLGNAYSFSNYGLDGELDNVRLYNRALTVTEVSQLYAAEAGNLDTDGDGLTDARERGFGRYQVIPGSFTWEQAKADAEARGGHLATITSEEEWTLVNNSISNLGEAWLGGFQAPQSIEPAGGWGWVTGEPWSFVAWNVAPDNAGGNQSSLRMFTPRWDDTENHYANPAGYLLEFGYPTDPTLADTDGDGFNDSIETYYDSDPNNPAVTPNTIRPAGAVIAWGSDSNGQTAVPANLTDVIQIGGGERYSAALRRSGEVVAWGHNGWQEINVPARAQSNVVEISASGSRGQTVLLGSGEVLFWGDSSYGQNNVPDEAKQGIVAVSAGSRHSMALTAAGEVLVWGDNQYGQTSVPTDARSEIHAISAGGYHSLALTKSGRVVAWGDNGNGATTVPAECNSGIVAIAGGDQHSLALTVDGKVLAWGNSLSGATTVPTAALSGVKQISASGASSYALKQDGTILAWGRGAEGQLNVPATYQNSYLSVRGGYHHSLAIISGTPPVITTPSTLIGTVGVPLEYSVTASGTAPITFGATNLPTDLNIATNGLISGTPTAAGTNTATLSASNAFGTTNQIAAFVIAKGTPLLSGITATSIAAGQSLSTSTISGTAVNDSGLSVAGIFTFVTPARTPALGTDTQSIVFTPSDTANYNTATASVSVTVALNPSGDEDGDGATNEAELAAGTDPYDSASGPYQPVALGDAFTAKLAAGMTTKVTTASLISNDKYSGIPAETRGVTFQGAATTSTKGATVEVKAGWLIYRPSSSAQNGTSDTFTYTVSNGIKTATGTVTVSLVSPDMTIEVDFVSRPTLANGWNATFLVMPGMTFEVQGKSGFGTGAEWIVLPNGANPYWTSGADGRLIVTDPVAVGSASRFYKFRWIP